MLTPFPKLCSLFSLAGLPPPDWGSALPHPEAPWGAGECVRRGGGRRGLGSCTVARGVSSLIFEGNRARTGTPVSPR